MKKTGVQSVQIPGEGEFNEVYSFTYTGTYGKLNMGGLVAEFQNSSTGNAAFAVAIAQQKDKSKLKGAVNSILNSLAAN